MRLNMARTHFNEPFICLTIENVDLYIPDEYISIYSNHISRSIAIKFKDNGLELLYDKLSSLKDNNPELFNEVINSMEIIDNYLIIRDDVKHVDKESEISAYIQKIQYYLSNSEYRIVGLSLHRYCNNTINELTITTMKDEKMCIYLNDDEVKNVCDVLSEQSMICAIEDDKIIVLVVSTILK